MKFCSLFKKIWNYPSPMASENLWPKYEKLDILVRIADKIIANSPKLSADIKQVWEAAKTEANFKG